MKFRILTLILLAHFCVTAQRKITPTDSFTIKGNIKKEKTLTVKQLDSFPKTKLEDRIIYNHKGEIKDTIRNIKGVSLKTILKDVEFVYEKPKELNEFYFVLAASDGYKVVLSWNEIYNNDLGNNFYFITEMDGKSLKDLEQRIVFVATSDIQTGRRYIKALEKIEVKRIE